MPQCATLYQEPRILERLDHRKKKEPAYICNRSIGLRYFQLDRDRNVGQAYSRFLSIPTSKMELGSNNQIQLPR
jgi:hypothetical protein